VIRLLLARNAPPPDKVHLAVAADQSAANAARRRRMHHERVRMRELAGAALRRGTITLKWPRKSEQGDKWKLRDQARRTSGSYVATNSRQ